jgi:hypothetical protein
MTTIRAKEMSSSMTPRLPRKLDDEYVEQLLGYAQRHNWGVSKEPRTVGSR